MTRNTALSKAEGDRLLAAIAEAFERIHRQADALQGKLDELRVVRGGQAGVAND